MCPIVPMFTCGFVRSYFAFAIATSRVDLHGDPDVAPTPPTLAPGPAKPCRGSTWSPCPGLNRRPRPYQGRALPSELHGRIHSMGAPNGPQTPNRSHPARRSRASARFPWSGKRDSNPRPPAWKAGALPLSYSRAWRSSSHAWWGGEDLNPRRRLPADLQSAPFGHLGTSPNPPACLRIPPKLPKTLAL